MDERILSAVITYIGKTNNDDETNILERQPQMNYINARYMYMVII